MQSHTGEYIAEKISDVIQEVKEECGKTTIAVVTDNTSNMKKSWRLLEDKYPDLTCYGCAAHSLNLVLSDLLKLELQNKLKIKAKLL